MLSSTSAGRPALTLRDRIERIAESHPDGVAEAERVLARFEDELREAKKCLEALQRPWNPYEQPGVTPWQPFPHPGPSPLNPWPPNYPDTWIRTTEPWWSWLKDFDFVVTDPPPNLTGHLSLSTGDLVKASGPPSLATTEPTIFDKRFPFPSLDGIGISILGTGHASIH